MATSTSPRSFLEEEEEALARPDIVESSQQHPFQWLNRWMVVFPMISRHTIKADAVMQRNDVFYKVCAFLTVLLLVSWCCADVIYPFITDGFTLYSFVWALSIAMLNLSRLLTMYYFVSHVGFFGIDKDKDDVQLQSAYLHASGLRQVEYDKLTTQYSVRMKIILITAVVCLVVISIFVILETVVADSKLSTLSGLRFAEFFAAVYFYDIPLFLIQFMLSIQYCKGCVFILSLTKMVETSLNVNWKEITDEYSQFHHKFKNATKLLEYVVILRLASLLAFVWVDISLIGESKTWIEFIDNCLWCLLGILPFVELASAGNPTTINFHSFRHKLYDVGLEQGALLSNEYLYLLNYVDRYPFLIQILSKEISFRNAAKIAAAFVVAKTVSYLFKAQLA